MSRDTQRHQSFSSLVERLRQNVRATLSAIKRIVADERLTDSQKVALIDSELNPTDAKPGQLELQFDAFEQSAAKLHEGPDRLTLLEARSLKLQHRVAEIVRQVEFAPNCSKAALFEALAQYRHKAGVPDKHSPIEFLRRDGGPKDGAHVWHTDLCVGERQSRRQATLSRSQIETRRSG